jgi:hypothetical protein
VAHTLAAPRPGLFRRDLLLRKRPGRSRHKTLPTLPVLE